MVGSDRLLFRKILYPENKDAGVWHKSRVWPAEFAEVAEFGLIRFQGFSFLLRVFRRSQISGSGDRNRRAGHFVPGMRKAFAICSLPMLIRPRLELPRRAKLCPLAYPGFFGSSPSASGFAFCLPGTPPPHSWPSVPSPRIQRREARKIQHLISGDIKSHAMF